MNPPTILIVEPDPHIAKVLQITFEATLPVETVVANEPDQVRQFIDTKVPDLVVADVFTRKFNVFEVIAFLRTTPACQHTPIIALGPRGKQVELARAMGCQEIVTLPFRVPDIIATVLRNLDVEPELVSSDLGTMVARVVGPRR